MLDISRMNRLQVLCWILLLTPTIVLSEAQSQDTPANKDMGYKYGGSRESSAGEDELPDVPIYTSILRPPPTTEPGYIKVDFHLKNVTKYVGETVRLKCEITGDPVPRYQWLKNDAPILEEKGRISMKPTLWGSRLKIESLDTYDTGYYKCIGSNQYGSARTVGVLYVNPGPNPNAPDPTNTNQPDTSLEDLFGGRGIPGGFRPGKNNQPKIDEVDKKDQSGFCQPYLGATCGKYLKGKDIFVTSKYEQGHNDERLTAAIAMIAASSQTRLSEYCGRYAIQSLCYFTFPMCDLTVNPPRPLRIRRDECMMVENHLCLDEYRKAKQNPVLGTKLILPECNDLPPDGSPQAANSISMNIPNVKQWYNSDQTCYNDTGKQYRGTMSEGLSGRDCERWTHTWPQQLYYDPLKHKMLGNHNYCRNPGGEVDQPWCFTRNGLELRQEPCDIPKCEPTGGGTETMSEIMFILIPSVAVPIALIFLIVIICMCRRSRKNNASPSKVPKNLGQNMELSPLNVKQPPLRAREFPMSSIRFVQELGEGTFGKVYKGELIGLYSESSITPVALKTVKAETGGNQKLHNEFRQEADKLTDLRHINVVCLIGVCTKESPNLMLFEYMTHGDLHEFLIMHSPHSDVSCSDEESRTLDHSEMLYIAVQIAAGMEFLAAHQFIHKDLAARNILVGDNYNVKISDFGLAREIYATDYYRVQSKSVLPVRWMPPEAILYGRFTTESDVWSYGVVLWEVFSYGLQPYYGYINQEVIEMIRARQILPCPDECPARMYAMMVECWHEMPSRRPSFSDIHARLRQWQGETMAAQKPNLTITHSHSGHSSSTHQSTHSHPSQHSSTGPSNNTATTGLTGSSSGGYGPVSGPRAVQMPNPMLQHQMPYRPMTNQQNTFNKRPSPPPSVSSHKSSAQSSASSSIGYKSGGEQSKPSNPTTPIKLTNLNKAASPGSQNNQNMKYILESQTSV
ncbi:inactive tyrosine-protein kinase transmembrane receptor ROR1-like isoform X3 [Lineus longissimus]|uniref:inactive tyrosine-protein kinase transmembrane receptor ROR1-like isoform X3 n=1 Tax=Lineus longissimus TaxID=88925 RepID=UPI00315DA0A3